MAGALVSAKSENEDGGAGQMGSKSYSGPSGSDSECCGAMREYWRIEEERAK